MRRTRDELAGPVSLVYIAGNVVEAQQVERTFTERGLDYAVSLEPFTKSSTLGAVFGGTYAGAFFYVSAMQRAQCVKLLKDSGLSDTVEWDESVTQGES